MSGGSSTGIPRGPGDENFDCESVSIETILNSPDPTVLDGLKEGQRLSVEVELTAQNRQILVAVAAGSLRAGSLTPPQLIELIDCIRKKNRYIATVLAKPRGGVCRVRITPGVI